MPSLRELQQDFADAVLGPPGLSPAFAASSSDTGAERLAIYRNALFANYRGALSATYPVVKRLTDAPFFHAAVDAFAHAHPSTSGDLNLYGDAFARFLAAYPPAAQLPYLPDVARLEWAIDEAQRTPDAPRVPEAVLAALSIAPAQRLPALELPLEPSCRLIRSTYPILHLWQVNQPDYQGDTRVSLDEGADRLLVRRDADGISLQRLAAGEFAWLAALADASTLAAAIDAAQAADPDFDLGSTLRAHIQAGTIAAVDAG
jgi:hypothetical protein